MATAENPRPAFPEYIPLASVGAPPAPVKPTQLRIDSIDLLRGIVMVIMMLDHTRDFVHRYALQGFDPTDLAHTSVKLFFTRWITHFCAPVFVFLAGTGAYLQFARGKSKRELSRFLVTRGLWLIVLEFTLVRIGAFFNLDYRFLGVMQVIWVIGVSMIVLAALIHLPLRVVTGFGLLMIALHNLLDRFHVQGWHGPNSPVPGVGAKLYIILHQPYEAFPIFGFPSPVVFVLYNLVPWIGVMAAGYGFGALYQMDVARRRRLLLTIGGLATVLFLVLRAINHYGDPSAWARQDTIAFTIISFLNTTKYPPSLLFLLMTLGPALLVLAWFESSTASQRFANNPSLEKRGFLPDLVEHLRNALVTFGRVPLFFYLLQWPTAHLEIPAHPMGSVSTLRFVYACWIAGVVLLYPLCKWFAGVKQRRRDWWLSYL